MDRTASRLLLYAAGLSFAIALLHVGIIFGGSAAYTYFGAPELAPLEAAGSPVPDLLTAALALVFAVCGAYALAGAGRIRRLPLLPLGLWGIGAVFTLRGLALGPELVRLARGSGTVPPRYVVFSLVALATGLAFLAGTWRAKLRLRTRGSAAS